MTEEAPQLSPEQLVRLSVNINAETLANLQFLSTIQGATKTEVVRRAIALMKFLDEEQRNGRMIMTMSRNEKEWRELVLV